MAAEEEKARARSKYDDRLQAADIMDIPELEEEGKEDLSRVVGGWECPALSCL